MSARYTMQEMVDFRHAGRTVLYPRMLISRCLDTDGLLRSVARETTFSVGELRAMLMLLARGLASAMAEGQSVRLDGIGRFTPSLSLKAGREREQADGSGTRRNAASIQVGKVNFRADRELVGETRRRCTLERAPDNISRRLSPYTPEERLALALDFLDRNTVMRPADYAALTGMSRTAAGKELRLWQETPGSGIGSTGAGPHKVYIRRQG